MNTSKAKEKVLNKRLGIYQHFVFQVRAYLLVSGDRSFLVRKLKNLKDHKALSPTSTYTILDNIVISPNKVATKSKSKIPTSNQFKPPIIKRVKAIISTVFMVSPPYVSMFNITESITESD